MPDAELIVSVDWSQYSSLAPSPAELPFPAEGGTLCGLVITAVKARVSGPELTLRGEEAVISELIYRLNDNGPLSACFTPRMLSFTRIVSASDDYIDVDFPIEADGAQDHRTP